MEYDKIRTAKASNGSSGITVPKQSELASISYVGKVNGIDVTNNLMLDESNSTKNVIHFMLPKPVVMNMAEQVNKNGQVSSELMQFSLEPSEDIPPSTMASTHMRAKRIIKTTRDVQMWSAFSFSVISSIIVIFSFDPATSLMADKICKPNYRNFIAFEDRDKNDRGKDSASLKKKILLVDDEPDSTFSFKEGLEYTGFNVDIFNDAVHALENFRPDFYDLVILDIVMPEMDGFDLYKELEKLDPRINVCFLTASEQHREDQREVKHKNLGQNLFIQKPIYLEDLKKEINKRTGTTE